MKDKFFRVLDKWEKVCDGEMDGGSKDCAFCHAYAGIYNQCSGCPVEAFVDETGCCGTPYAAWSRLANVVRDSAGYLCFAATTPEAVIAAEKELEFLNCVFEDWIKKNNLQARVEG